MFSYKSINEELAYTRKKIRTGEDEILNEVKAVTKKNIAEIDVWLLAGQNLLNRAKAVLAILGSDQEQKKAMIAETLTAKENYKQYLSDHLQPKRLKDTTDRIFDPLVFALKNS